jgi:nucleoside permease NupC
MGGNGGMNAHLSAILSWLLEPLANSMGSKSSEVISGEHMKSKIDSINLNNKEWKEGE